MAEITPKVKWSAWLEVDANNKKSKRSSLRAQYGRELSKKQK